MQKNKRLLVCLKFWDTYNWELGIWNWVFGIGYLGFVIKLIKC